MRWIMQPHLLDGELDFPIDVLFVMNVASLDRERQTNAATPEPGKLSDTSTNLT